MLRTTFTVANCRKIFSNMYDLQRYVTLVSYWPNKNKVVMLLSTRHNDKPEIIQYYSSTKAGVDDSIP